MKSHRIAKLSQLPAGTRGTIVALNSENELQGRLMGLGMMVGSEIRLLRGTRIGKTVLVAVGETRLAVGADLARQVLVELEMEEDAAEESCSEKCWSSHLLRDAV